MNSIRLASIMLVPLLLLTVHTAGANGPIWTIPYNSLYFDPSSGQWVELSSPDAAGFIVTNTAYIGAILQGKNIGLIGNAAGGAIGVSGHAGDTGVVGDGTLTGIKGYSGNGGVAVYGEVPGAGIALAGFAYPNGTGVYGASSSGPGVYGFSSTGNAGEFHGDVNVVGTLSKGGGGFKIDHPLDPANKFLSHSFMESPDMKTVYDGVTVLDASGQAVVELPNWFEALNRDFRYQLTAVGRPAPDLHIAEEIANNRFRIAGGPAQGRVSWQVTGVRRDAYAEHHRVPVEGEKSAAERGKYLYPVENDQPERLGIYFGDVQKAETIRTQASRNNEELQQQLKQLGGQQKP
jgi:hypothetical protein